MPCVSAELSFASKPYQASIYYTQHSLRWILYTTADLLQLGASAAEAAGKVASAMGSELHAVKTKCVENAVSSLLFIDASRSY
jgi:hypothetical protein